MGPAFGVYVHFPYCLSKCPYCDFASVAARVVPGERYAKAVAAELSMRKVDRAAQSVYLGGGTPSLWEPGPLAGLLGEIFRRFEVEPSVEVTLEANPGASDSERFHGYRAAGVNRLSIGVQSFRPSTLSALGRAHGPEEALAAIERARAAGFENLSVDLIYGVHGQSLEEVREDVRLALSRRVDHLSAYALTLDREVLAEEVPLARLLSRGEVSLPPEEEVLEMGRAIREACRSAGLERYEISNFARPGLHSRHNTLYWTGGEYLGLGAGATGYLSGGEGTGFRYSNLRSPEQYLEALEQGRLPEASRERLGRRELFAERVAMGLRLSRGVELEAACRELGFDYAPRRAEAQRLVARGLAVKRDGWLSLTDAGADLHSEVAARLI
ncbi:MAG: radical SAM family heme chaperone HemW [Myxococcales bacterium]|nr:radical SAM family heme chaperone HemW [Myxococcales bacterium]